MEPATELAGVVKRATQLADRPYLELSVKLVLCKRNSASLCYRRFSFCCKTVLASNAVVFCTSLSHRLDSIGSRFLLIGGSDGAKHLDGYHVAFGRVVDGMDTVKAMTNLYCVREKPIADLVIDECGVVSGTSSPSSSSKHDEDSREAAA